MLNIGFKVVSNNYYVFLQYVFTLTTGKMSTAMGLQRSILEIQKLVEVLSYPRTVLIIVKKVEFYLLT